MTDNENKLHIHNENIKELLKTMPTQENLEKATNVFSLLSDVTRLKILWLLCHSEECVSNIAHITNMSLPAVSFHLRFLKQSNIITYKKIGKETHYKLSDTPYSILIHQMIDDIFEINCK